MKNLNEDQEILLDIAQKLLMKMQFSNDGRNTLKKAIAILNKLNESLNEK